MAQLNAFHAHILEACTQRGLTEPEVLRQVKAIGYGGLECGCRQLTEERRQCPIAFPIYPHANTTPSSLPAGRCYNYSYYISAFREIGRAHV